MYVKNTYILLFFRETICNWMASNWDSLVELGWQKIEENVNNKRKTYYKSPPVNGVSRKIHQSRDLKSDEKHLSSILFPKTTKSTFKKRANEEIQVASSTEPREHLNYNQLIFLLTETRKMVHSILKKKNIRTNTR